MKGKVMPLIKGKDLEDAIMMFKANASYETIARELSKRGERIAYSCVLRSLKPLGFWRDIKQARKVMPKGRKSINGL